MCRPGCGFVYVAFVIDAFSRRIVGWRAATIDDHRLVLDAVEHAFFTRAQEGNTSLRGLIAHNDAGSQAQVQGVVATLPVRIKSR